MRLFLTMAVAVGLLFSAVSASAQGCSNPTFPGSSITLVSGTLNGNSLDPAAPQLTVSPGAALSGTVRIRVVNTGPGNDVFPVCWTPSWGGNHSAIGHSIAGWQSPGTTEYDVPISLTASSTTGAYYIFFAAQWEMTCSNVLSCTAWTMPGGDRWNDGRDVADWSSVQAQQAVTQGWVCSEWDNVVGVITEGVPAAAIRVDVANCSTGPQFPGSKITLVSGTLNNQPLNPAAPQVAVCLGGPITGAVRIRVVNTGPGNDVFPVCWTPSWGGGHPAIGHSIAGWQSPGTTEYDVPISLTASSTPGTYHIFFAAQWEMTCGNVLSCTAWTLPGGDRWNDGRDVADWSNAQAQQALMQGWVCSEWDNVAGVITEGVPAAVIEVQDEASTAVQKRTWGALKARYR
jgi:hypothetical protein